jgi:transcriptional regulator GlxA family with amidase domain
VYREKDLKEKLEEAKCFLERNYADPNLSVEALAAQADMSAVYFRRLFKEQYGIPPSRYLTSVRLKNAKELMKLNKTSSVLFSLSHSISHISHTF